MSLQANPDDATTDCYTATTETNSLIDFMMRAENYKGGEIN
jgi:hypothetical protein